MKKKLILATLIAIIAVVGGIVNFVTCFPSVTASLVEKVAKAEAKQDRKPATAVDGAKAGITATLEKQLPSVEISPSPIHGDYTGSDFLGLKKKYLS